MRFHLFFIISISIQIGYLFSQTKQMGMLESGEFSVHKYFYDTYKDFEAPVVDEAYPDFFNYKNKTINKYKVFGYFPYWFLNRWNTISYQLLYVIAFHSAEIDSLGNIVNDHGWLTNSNVTNFINKAKQNNVKITLSATLFSGNSITALLTNPSARINLIQNLIQLVKARNVDGIDINFEGIQSGQRDNLTSFLRQLRDSLKANDSSYILTCAPTDFDFRQGDWDLTQVTSICDLTFLQCYGYAYSTGSQAGPVGRLQGWSSINATTYVNSALQNGAIPSKVVYGMPHYGYDWPVNSPEKKASTLGAGSVLYYPEAKLNAIEYTRLWDTESLNAWYRYKTIDNIWHQAWYEDPQSAYYKYQFIKSKNLAGVGIWALGMDNTNKDIWNVLEEFVKDTNLIFPPEQPILLYVKGKIINSQPVLEVKWNHLSPEKIKGYRLYLSKDSIGFNSMPFIDENYLRSDSNIVVIDNLELNSSYYVKITAVNTAGEESLPSDIYGASLGIGNRYLIIDGFDRTSGSYNLSYHNFAYFYSSAIKEFNREFDAAANETISAGLINLNEYSGIFWFLGDESTANKTFNPNEQLVVMEYLRGGGKLFITGSEIGYELSSTSPTFLSNYLKANFVQDNSGSLSVYSNGILFRIFPSDIILGGTYPEDWPDVIQPVNGSQVCLLYRNQKTAGIFYDGIFPNGTVPGKLIFLSFALETTLNLVSKNLLIEDAIRFFEGITKVYLQETLPEGFWISNNFPNPFNEKTKVLLNLPTSGFINLSIFNILGQQVYKQGMYLKSGLNELIIDGKEFNSGIYFVKISSGNQHQLIKINLIK